MKRLLDPHQDEAIAFIRAHNGQAGVFMAPGTGKTLVAIRYTTEHLPEPRRYPALVLGRRDDYMTWRDELQAEGIPRAKIQEIEGSSSAKDAYNRYHMAGRHIHPWWTLVTYDLMRDPEVRRYVAGMSWQVVIADELHSIKRIEAERTKWTLKSTRHVPVRLGLTGTPITNEPSDVFTECLFIDDGRTFGSNWWKFRTEFYIKAGMSWVRRRGSKPEIIKRLRRVAFHVHEDDVLKLPPVRRVTKAVPMSGMQRKLYEQVLHDWEYQIAGGKPNEINQVVVQLAKLRQIASGFVYKPSVVADTLERGVNPADIDIYSYSWEAGPRSATSTQVRAATHRLRSSKLELMLSHLEDDDEFGPSRYQKVVIWAAHTADVIGIADALRARGDVAVTFCGSNRLAKEQARRRFRDDSACRFFIGQADSGVGMNELTVANIAMYFSNSQRVVSRQQSERRIRRRGSETHDHILYVDYITEGTCEVGIHRDLKRGVSYAKSVTDALKRGASIREALSLSELPET